MTTYEYKQVTFAALAAMAVALSVAMLVSSVAASVAAKIRQACETSSGHEPPRQQPECKGEGLQDVAKNPAGHKPPGHQP
jgi:hypothetical protein